MGRRLIIGGLILIVGVAVFLFSQQQVQQAQTLAGQAGRAVSQQSQSEYQMFSIARIAGGILVVIGGVLSASDFLGS
jgi:GAF domain-containing protein